jgi:acetolactate synthase-1/2/3 large subunit
LGAFDDNPQSIGKSMNITLRGADVLTRALVCAGTRNIFSLSGNQIMPVYDAAIDARLEIIHVRHEGAAVHMADAWGRLKGEPGIALVTGGPGHANAIGALYTALAADSPLVLLSGHAPLAQLGMDAFQEMRQADLAEPIVKASWTAQSAGGLGTDIARAIRIARSGRPGPVHLSLPLDVLEARIPEHEAALPKEADFTSPATLLSNVAAQAILAQIAQARRPLIIVGPSLAGERGQAARTALAAAGGVAVLCMESPRGVNDPGLGAVAEVLAEADLVVLIGKRLDFTMRFGRAPAFAPACRFIQIDPDPLALERTARACGNPERIVLSAIADSFAAVAQLTSCAASTPARDAGWGAEVEAASRYRPPAWDAANNSAGPLNPVEVGRAVQRVIDRATESVLVVDGGEFGQWSQACVSAPCRLINGPAGSIGSAIPFALAAKLARPKATVIAMLGDGTFGFHMAEFDTAVRHGLPIVAIVGNDACWNAEHQIQINSYGRGRAIGCELLPTRYDQAVAGLGGYGEFVTCGAELVPALERALSVQKPACVNVLVERLAAPNISRKGGLGAGSAH